MVVPCNDDSTLDQTLISALAASNPACLIWSNVRLSDMVGAVGAVFRDAIIDLVMAATITGGCCVL